MARTCNTCTHVLHVLHVLILIGNRVEKSPVQKVGIRTPIIN
jgi:hypothetical protein